jgi:hypothetical protein
VIMKTAVLIIFWAISWVALISIFTGSGEWQKIDYLYTSVFIVTLLIPSTVNDWYLRPRLLNKGRYWLYFTLLIALVFAGALLNQELFDKFIDYILPGYYFISYYEYFDIVKFFGAFLSLTTLIGLSIEWFQLQQVEKEKAGAEFRALVNQVNPHFLFNSLTVLYTLSLRDSKETSAAIIKLSDILRYVIYQSSQATVTLGSEARLVRDFIDLQRYRVHPTTRIEISEKIDNESTLVSPMLFLPLVENSFKHGVHGEIENAFVSIGLQEEGGVVNFTITNNKPGNGNAKSMEGIGLKNLRERLSLIYRGRHEFTISETATTFNITMKVRP